MRFKVDENLPVEVADLLRGLGTTQLLYWSNASAGGPILTLQQYASRRQGR